ncbi:MAG: gliding motility lipoprotein GldH [Bacteroidota bacterium]
MKKLLIFVFVVSFVSCDDKMVFDEYKTISGGTWDKDEIVSFSLEAPDTTSNYNLYLNLRNNNDYKYNNLYLIVEMNFPHGKTLKDTLNYKMARPDGSFLGTGFSDVKENKLWYKGHEAPFVFEESGDYDISIQHAMRENGTVDGIENLEGITDVGFRVEPVTIN